MTIDLTQMVQDCMNAINERIRSLRNLNIIVAGKTGVGKSTLINSIFRENLADTGIGMPVTTHMKQYSKKDFPLTIYDTRGFELGKDAQKEVKQEILETIRKGHAAKDINQAIHCIWYCINTASDRIEPEEIEWLRDFAEENKLTQVPVILVLTKSFSKKNAKQMRDYILNENLSVCQVVPVLASDYEIDEDYVIKAYGLDTLIEIMTQMLPEELQDTLQSVQKVSLEHKKKRAHAAVAAATTAAFGEGFAPIPFADAALLVPTQVTMIASITAIFGLNISRSIITGFVSSTIGAGGATILGRTIAANLIKLLPGAGTAAGGMISGATAGLLTTALGEAYIQLLTAVYQGELKASEISSEAGKKKMKELFKSRLKANRNTERKGIQ